MAKVTNSNIKVAKEALKNYKNLITTIGYQELGVEYCEATSNFKEYSETALIENKMKRDLILNSLNVLDKNERLVIEGLYINTYLSTYDDLSKDLCLSDVRIRQIETNALTKMQPFLIMSEGAV